MAEQKYQIVFPDTTEVDKKLPPYLREGKLRELFDKLQKDVGYNEVYDRFVPEQPYIEYMTPADACVAMHLAIADLRCKAVRGAVFTPISKDGRVQLGRYSDMIDNIRMTSHPCDTKYDITLSLEIGVPTDESARDEWVATGTINVTDIFAYPNKFETISYPLRKAVGVTTESVQFFDRPLPVFWYYMGFSLQFEQHGPHEFVHGRHMKFDAILVDPETRELMGRKLRKLVNVISE